MGFMVSEKPEGTKLPAALPMALWGSSDLLGAFCCSRQRRKSLWFIGSRRINLPGPTGAAGPGFCQPL